MKFSKTILGAALLASLLLAVGCTNSTPPNSTSGTSAEQLPASFFVDAKPSGAVSLAEAKSSSKAGETVTFEARIGGRAKPFVDGRAVVIIADSAIKSCDELHGDSCPTPWDYCCEAPASLLANTATLQFVDAQGKTLPFSIEDQQGLNALRTITVVGTVQQKEGETFVVNAQQVFVTKS